jgi:hypothetical protein
MAKSSIPSPDEALAGMANSGRTPMGKSGASFTSPSASPKAGKLVKKTGNAKGATDPYAQPVGIRKNVPDTHGASYGIRARYMRQTSPEAGATQANGRMFKSVVNRTNPNFEAGNSTSY